MKNNPDEKAKLTKYLSSISFERFIGYSGVAVLSAASLLAFLVPNSPSAIAALGVYLSGLGLNVFGGFVLSKYQELINSKKDDDIKLQLLVEMIEQDIKKDARLRIEIGKYLDDFGSFRIAQEIAKGNPAVSGWLLSSIHQEVINSRAVLNTIAEKIEVAGQEASTRTTRTEPRDTPADLEKRELLVLVANFDVSRNQALVGHPQDDVFIKLSQNIERLTDLNLNIFVEKVVQPESIFTIEQARRIFDERKATIFIWGQATKDTIRYVYLTEPRWAAAHSNRLLGIPIDLRLSEQGKEFAIEGSGGADFILSYVIASLYLADGKPKHAGIFMNEALRFAKQFPQVKGVKEAYYLLQASVMIALTFVLVENGLFEPALQQIDRAIEVSPPYMPVLHLLRSAVRSNLNDLDGAMNDVNHEIDLDPNNAEAFAVRAQLNETLGIHDKALTDCDSVLSLDPGYVWVYPVRSLANRGLGNYVEATKDLDNAIKHRKSFEGMRHSVEARNAWFAEMYDRLANIYSLRGMWKEAIDNLDKVIKLGTQTAEVYNHMGQMYDKLQLWDKAIVSFQSAVSVDPTSPFGKDAKIRMEVIQEVLAERKIRKS